jgi:hypothetical protein
MSWFGRLAFVALGAVVALVGATACGPDKKCSTVAPHDASSADLVVLETLPNSSQRLVDASSGPPVYQPTSLKITLSDSSSGNSDHCLSARFDDEIASAGFAIDMDCPPSPGAYSLMSLSATLCEAVGGVGGGGCQPITGTITIRTITRPCVAAGGGSGACGVLDADLVIDDTPKAPLPSISGKAHLAYTESIEPVECAPTPTFPGGG